MFSIALILKHSSTCKKLRKLFASLCSLVSDLNPISSSLAIEVAFRIVFLGEIFLTKLPSFLITRDVLYFVYDSLNRVIICVFYLSTNGSLADT